MIRSMFACMLITLLVFTSPGTAARQTPPSPALLSYIESSSGLTPPALEAGDTELEMGDVNADGNPDIVSIGDHGSPYVNTSEHGVMVWLGDGAGQWSVQQVGGFGYGGVALGDANGDGFMDVGYGMHHNYSGVDFGDQLLEVALGDGTSQSWTPWDDGLATNGEWWGMFATDFADVDNDGDLDLGATSFGCCNGIHVYLNQADGSWVQSWASPDVGPNGNNMFTFGDFNGDGNIDLVGNIYDSEDPTYGMIYSGDGTGQFTNQQGNLPTAESIVGIDLGEANADGKDELAITNSNGGVQVWQWVAPATWQNISGALPATGGYEAVQLYDMNMDGWGDVAAFGNGVVRVWAGDGSGGWSELASLNTPTPGSMHAFRVGADADHNGYPDIALVSEEGGGWNYQNHLHFYKETSTPAALRITPVLPSSAQVLHAGAVTFVDWTSAVPGGGQGSVSLELSAQGPAGPWQAVVSGVPNNGRYQWLIPASTASTDNAYLRYTLSVAGETVQAITTGAFRIHGSVEQPISGLHADNDGPTLLGEMTTLCATVISGTNVAYAWELGDGTTANGPVVTHSYPAPGVYTATVTASNSVSSAQDQTWVTIFEQPIEGLGAENDSPTLLGETTYFSATVVTGTNVIFGWDFGDGGSALGQFASHVFTDTGVFTATVTASNAVSSVQASTLVEVIPLPPGRRYWLPLMWKGN